MQQISGSKVKQRYRTVSATSYDYGSMLELLTVRIWIKSVRCGERVHRRIEADIQCPHCFPSAQIPHTHDTTSASGQKDWLSVVGHTRQRPHLPEPVRHDH